MTTRDKFNLQRVVVKQQNWPGIFPKMLPFCECNSVNSSQNIQTEVSLKRSIFADVVAYQFTKLNRNLSGSRKENINRSIWNENHQSTRPGIN